jgi:Zn-dependent protease
MISLLSQDPLLFVLVVVVMIISVSIHEFSHAFTAYKLGDPTAKYLKRLTLDPRAHIDPVGAIFLLLFGFGWGKPVPFNPINLKNPKRDSALIALAGPFSNFVLATFMAVLIKILGLGGLVGGFLYLGVFYNLFLGFFNLLPFGPLDGFKIVFGFLPHNLAIQWAQMESFGLYILLFLVISRSIGQILNPVVGFALKMLGLSAV